MNAERRTERTASCAEVLGDVVSFPSGDINQSRIQDDAAIVRGLVAASRGRHCADFFDRMCPRLYRESDWAHRDLAANLDNIERILAWSFGPRGLFVSGPARSGKTRAVWGLLKRLLLVESRRVTFLKGQEFAARIVEELSFGKDEARTWVESIADVEVLTLDDLGQQGVAASADDRVLSWLLWLVDYRLSEGLPIIVTSNMPGHVIAGSGDRGRLRHDPLVGRVLESCDVIKFREPQ
jgi:DNA replication protein DnaC